MKLKTAMRMAEKYYTPVIEEFHVGFEYEFRGTNDQTGPWQKAVIKDGAQIDDITRQLIGGRKVYELRVQYLDKEDTKGEGFTYDEQYKEFVEKEHHTSVFHKSVNHRGGEKKLMLLYNNVSHWTLLSVSGGDGAYWAEKVFDRDDKGELSIPVITITAVNTVFAGTVKNKSELKKVLAQIGIS